MIWDLILNLVTTVRRALMGSRLVLFGNYLIRTNERSEVTPIDHDATISGETYNVVSPTSIVDVDANMHVDIRAVVTKNELTTINSQKLLRKRTLVLCDDNNKSVEVILWEAGIVELVNKNYKTIKLLQ